MTKRLTTHLAALACASVLIVACSAGSDASDVDVSSSEEIDDEETDDTDPEDEDSGVDGPAGTVPDDEPVTTDAADGYSNPQSLCADKVSDGEYESADCNGLHDAEFAGYVTPDGVASDDEEAEAIRIATACAAPVEELVQRPMSKFGIEVGATVFDDGVAQCWAEPSAAGVLVGLIGDIGIDAAIGNLQFLPDLAPGTCFEDNDVNDEAYEIVIEVSCDTPAAEQLFAIVALDDRGYPGEDAVTEEGFAKCDVALTATTTELISQSYSIVYPDELSWTALGRRDVMCSAIRDESDVESVGFWDKPASFEWGVDAPVCLMVIDDGDPNDNSAEWNEVACDEPHTDELLAVPDAPFEALPHDAQLAIEVLRDLCNPFLETQTGQRRELPGLSIGFSVSAGLGELIDGPVACMATTNQDPFLVGSLTTSSIDEVLGDIVLLSSLEPGTCFTFPGASFSLGIVADCSDSGAVMAVGTYMLDEVVGTPVLDDQRAERTRKCLPIYEASGLSGDVSTLSGTFPSDSSYLYDGERLATCDITPT